MTLHAAIRDSLQERIHSGEWELGARIPDEVNLAQEYGCARTTINRALQALADDGLIVRKRKGGTRVNPTPARWAKFEIPIIREEIEANGSRYRHQVLENKILVPPASVRSRLHMQSGDEALYLETMHLADDRPHAFEMRWVNPQSVPEILNAPLDQISANEWLVRTVPFSTGDVSLAASSASETIARALDIVPGSAVFSIDRTTWLEETFITTAKLFHRQDYKLYMKL